MVSFFIKRAAPLIAAVLLCSCAAPVPEPTAPPANQISVTQAPQPVSTPQATASPGATPAPTATATDKNRPPMPDALKVQDGTEPSVKVYMADDKSIREMPIEEYLQGVLAGEMKNDWPLEALKAQAILARTFTLQFIADKGGSKYEGAHVSTDITEAQAYDASGVNDRIRQAIEETRGQVVASRGALIYAWFHAHAGGITAGAKEGLEYEADEPGYIQSVQSPESDKAPGDDAQWTASFTQQQVREALAKADVKVDRITAISISKKGPSGRAVTLSVNGRSVSAPSLRLALGGTELKSTYLTAISLDGDKVVFKGKGYGHGVGMSQWGAYGMADEGTSAEDIIMHYFRDISIVSMW